MAAAQEDKVVKIDRITFSAPADLKLPERVEKARKKRGDRSTSDTIRQLLDEALK